MEQMGWVTVRTGVTVDWGRIGASALGCNGSTLTIKMCRITMIAFFKNSTHSTRRLHSGRTLITYSRQGDPKSTLIIKRFWCDTRTSELPQRWLKSGRKQETSNELNKFNERKVEWRVTTRDERITPYHNLWMTSFKHRLNSPMKAQWSMTSSLVVFQRS